MSSPLPDSSAPPSSRRLLSLDAYRGAVMLLLAANAFGFATLARKVDSGLVQWLGFQASHTPWISNVHLFGFAFWDMVQPAFMFIVGVALPFSYAKRKSRGDSEGRIMYHVLTRSLFLILLGVFISSRGAEQTNWAFSNVLAQIGLGYPFLALLAGRTQRTRMITGAAVLFGIWLLYALYPVPSGPHEQIGKVEPLSGFFAHWSIHTNVGAAFDHWFLNLFPRAEAFVRNPGGYSTLNFIPAFVTMLIGLICGDVLRDESTTPTMKVKRLLLGAALLLVAGVMIGETVCPIIKHLWTPSWTLFSGAYVVILLVLFYWVIDVAGWKHGVWILVVAGLNPLALYLMRQFSRGWTVTQLKVHFPFFFNGTLAPVMENLLPAILFWFVVWWMHRNKVYLRL